MSPWPSYAYPATPARYNLAPSSSPLSSQPAYPSPYQGYPYYYPQTPAAAAGPLPPGLVGNPYAHLFLPPPQPPASSAPTTVPEQDSRAASANAAQPHRTPNLDGQRPPP
ncbi:hypothetical protein FB45DRAFT_1020675 [Roridomyces roridus]|uniref:Uncharacterized protein n=1 Tax=Roridomyces roridus TaxID=1738132 RepID=A0AAD7CAY2_9AGAR|nr:hypothetical protein FB45DRAFT_1020670 [Roridomyces roridus]KAJ7643856.1 hypothetical protein FB45DRAFT_1020675 [Roridomyces roridus]